MTQQLNLHNTESLMEIFEVFNKVVEEIQDNEKKNPDYYSGKSTLRDKLTVEFKDWYMSGFKTDDKTYNKIVEARHVKSIICLCLHLLHKIDNQ